MDGFPSRRVANCIMLCKIYVLLLTCVAQGLNFGLGGKLGFPNPNELACENYPIVLRCPGTDVIEVISAEYGRQNAQTCATSPEQMRNTACYLPEAFDIMSAKCNNQTQCKVTVSDETFKPDPCPGTHKYLQVTFRCVKYLFGCPGTLTGIGSNTSAATSMEPQAGSWVRDPILKPEQIFFVPSSQQFVQEYRSKGAFLRGDDPIQIYDLPSAVAGTSFVIYDGTVFYVTKHRRIVKYSMRARIRIRESFVPSYSDHSRRGSTSDVELAVDEEGLWLIYTTARDAERIVVSKLNKDSLRLEKTYKTSYPKQNAMHTFVICGVLYVVGKRSGNVEYMYNTNVDSKNGRAVSIGFDRNRPLSPSDRIGSNLRSNMPTTRRLFTPPSGLLAKTRSFRNYNFTSLKYNPRDRLLYAWDASNSNAVYYQLHYGLPQPADANLPPTTTPPPVTTTTTRAYDVITSRLPTDTSSGASTRTPAAPTSQNKAKCNAMLREGILWPATQEGEARVMPCPNAIGAEAVWRCELDQYTLEAHWADGPDMTRCGAWITDLESRLNAGDIDPAFATDKLSRDLADVSQHGEALNGNEITNAARVIKTASQQAGSDANQLTSVQVRRLTEGVTSAVSMIVGSENEQSWKSLSTAKRHETCDNILQSVENTGFVLADKVASSMVSVMPSSGVFRKLEQDDLLVQVNVQKSTHDQPIIFPDLVTMNALSPWSHITDQVILPAEHKSSLANVQGISKVVFSLINNVGKYANAPLSDDEDEEAGNWSVDSRVVSVSIDRPDHRITLKKPVKIVLENVQQNNENIDVSRKCVYWSYSQRDRKGVWSTDGCQVLAFNSSHTECSCTHLTSFAVLVNVKGVKLPSADHQLALHIITGVGICISLLCLAVCIYTFTFFRKLQDDRNTIHKHLCLSLFVAELVFLVGIEQTAYPIPCAVIAGVLHYSFLAAFMWMALEGFQLYVMLVEVFKGRSRWKWYYLIGYGIPAVIVGVSAVVDNSGYGTQDACWLRVDSGFIWSFVGPVCIVILCNLVFLAITVFKMYRHTRAYTDLSKLNTIKASVRGASVLLCLLGITWAFGILWVWESAPIMAYLFCIFNAFQGLWIFVFHCLLQKKVRAEYRSCCSRVSCCRKRGQESYVSNSMSFSKQYTPGRYSASNTTHSASLPTQTANSQLQRMWNETVVNGPRTSDSVAITHSQDMGAVPGRDLLRGGRGQRQSATQQFPSSSSPQLRRTSADRLLDAVPCPPPPPVVLTQGDHFEGTFNEDEVFLPQKTSGFAAPEMGEDAYEYDRLQRHCHTNDNCGRDCQPYYAGTECLHRHNTAHLGRGHLTNPPANAPRPHPRSMTMNVIKTPQQGNRFAVNDDTNRLRRQQLQRANTLAQQPDKQWEGRRPSSPTRRYSHPAHLDNFCPHHSQDEDCQGSCYHAPEPAHANQYHPYKSENSYVPPGKQRPTLEPMHGPRTHRRRRSLTSSDSDDPIVNDFSASSSAGSSCGNPSLSRTNACRALMADSVIPEHSRMDCDLKRDQQGCQDGHRETWAPLYRDEDDLEVQMLTDPNEPASSSERVHKKLGAIDNQRDSAFYQSMHDLNGSPAVNYSSPSSGCSPEMASADDDAMYHDRSQRIADPDNPRYVLSHPKSFKSSRTAAPAPKERVYEDMIIKSHDNEGPDGREKAYYKNHSHLERPESHEERYTEHLPSALEYGQSLLTSSRLQLDDASDTGRNSATSARMMTCL